MPNHEIVTKNMKLVKAFIDNSAAMAAISGCYL